MMRAFYRRAALDLAALLVETRDELTEAERDRDEWRLRAQKAERAEAELVELLARKAEADAQQPGQCRWVSTTTEERCGLREGHSGACRDSMGLFIDALRLEA